MEAYPIEMRKRVLADCDAGKQTREVALKYCVSEAWIRRLKQRRRENGEIAARKAGSTPPSKWKPHAERIAAAVRDRPDATLAELREQLGLDMSLATLTRALRALQLTFKKKSFMRRNKIARTSRHSGFNGKPK